MSSSEWKTGTMSTTRPEQDTRWRFHGAPGGAPSVAEREVLTERIERVVCRRCQGVDPVTLTPRPSAQPATNPVSRPL